METNEERAASNAQAGPSGKQDETNAGNKVVKRYRRAELDEEEKKNTVLEEDDE